MPDPIAAAISGGAWGSCSQGTSDLSINAYFGISAFFCFLTYLTLRGGWRQEGRWRVPALGFEAGAMAALSVGFAVYFWGVEGGMALVITIIVHEFGHVAAYRVIGHRDARFRLVPLMGGVAISDSLPSTQARGFFVSAMGPGICLALMIWAMAMQQAAFVYYPPAYGFFWYLAYISGAINFLNLLPLWPLDGGQMLRPIVHAFSPGLAQYATLAMSATFVALAATMQNMLILAFAVISSISAFNAPALSAVQRPLTKPQALLCLLIHLTMAGAFFLGAEAFILLYF